MSLSFLRAQGKELGTCLKSTVGNCLIRPLLFFLWKKEKINPSIENGKQLINMSILVSRFQTLEIRDRITVPYSLAIMEQCWSISIIKSLP